MQEKLREYVQQLRGEGTALSQRAEAETLEQFLASDLLYVATCLDTAIARGGDHSARLANDLRNNLYRAHGYAFSAERNARLHEIADTIASALKDQGEE